MIGKTLPKMFSQGSFYIPKLNMAYILTHYHDRKEKNNK